MKTGPSGPFCVGIDTLVPMNPSDTLSHACHQALAAELGDIDVSPGTPARQALHDAAELVLRLHRVDRNGLVQALKATTVATADAGVRAGDIAGMFGGPGATTHKAPLAAGTIAALLGLADDAHARRTRLVAAATGPGEVLQGTALVDALDTVPTWWPRDVPGGAFLNFLAHEGVPAWLVDAVRPEGVHVGHGNDFGDIGDLWTKAGEGMPQEVWCRAMGTGAVADLAVHALALHLLMHSADGQYAAGADHLRLGVLGQGIPAQPLKEPTAQWWTSARAMVSASTAVRAGGGAGVPMHALEHLVLVLSEGYTLATGLAAVLGPLQGEALLSTWEGEVNDWVDVLDARGSRLAGTLVPMAMGEGSAKRAKASLNRKWVMGLGTPSNDK